MFLLFCLNQSYQLRSKPIELRILPIIYFAEDSQFLMIHPQQIDSLAISTKFAANIRILL